jgi:rhodanese-related sulfurtransferase
MTNQIVTQMSALEGLKLIQKEPRVIFVDVRSEMEFLFIGHPVGSVNIPWIEEPDWEINPNFVRDIRRLMLGGVFDGSEHNAVPILLICRSGKRSEEAGNLLIDKSFNRVYNIEQGFEGDLNDKHQRSAVGGWRFDGLPWEQC